MSLDPRLETSSTFITNLSLCQVRLDYNAAFPWVILIPSRPNIVEIIDLSKEDQQLLLQDIAHTSQVMKTLFQADKLNVATLGNVVPQLHIHVIARYRSDPVWPNPVWNTIQKEYSVQEMAERIALLKDAFGGLRSEEE